MANSNEAVKNLRQALSDQDRNYLWLSRGTGYPYKRILAELKKESRPLSLEIALAASAVLGVSFPEVVEESGSSQPVSHGEVVQ